VFLLEVVFPVLVEVALAIRARSLRMASAVARPQRAPVMSMRSFEDRFGITGARWSPDGAEDILGRVNLIWPHLLL